MIMKNIADLALIHQTFEHQQFSKRLEIIRFTESSLTE